MAARNSTFSTETPLRIGYVPEHYLAPLHLGLALPTSPLQPSDVTLIPFPAGTGHMITSLRSDEIDIAIGLTEGWVAGLVGKDQIRKAKKRDDGGWDGGYAIVGQLVVNPLRWAIVTGRERNEIKDVEDLKGGKVGVSRMGSGSHIMSSVLSQKQSWLSSGTTVDTKPLEFVPCGPFPALRDAVTGTASSPPTADFFMWEEFTTKPFFYATEIQPAPPLKKVGEIFTPWPSWQIVASTTTVLKPEEDPRLAALFQTIDDGVKAFEQNTTAVVQKLGTGELGCHYNEEDATEWLKSVKFQKGTRGVDHNVIDNVVRILQGAGVVSSDVDDAVGRVTGISAGK